MHCRKTHKDIGLLSISNRKSAICSSTDKKINLVTLLFALTKKTPHTKVFPIHLNYFVTAH